MRELLKRGHYDDASLTGWGRLDELVAMMSGLRVFVTLGEMQTELIKSCYVPRWLIWNSLALKAVVGEPSIDAMQKGMFQDEAVLRLMGCTAGEIAEGFDSHCSTQDNKSFHVDTICYAIGQTPEEEVDKVWAAIIKKLVKIKAIGGGVYILDSTDIELDGEYEGIGVKKVVEEYTDERGRRKRPRLVKGLKLVSISNLYRGRLIVVAWRLLPIE